MSFDFVLLSFFHDKSPEKKIQSQLTERLRQVFLRALENTGFTWKHRLRLMSSLASALALTVAAQANFFVVALNLANGWTLTSSSDLLVPPIAQVFGI